MDNTKEKRTANAVNGFAAEYAMMDECRQNDVEYLEIQLDNWIEDLELSSVDVRNILEYVTGREIILS